MSSIDRHLMSGETVTFRTRLHWNVYIVPLLLVLVVFVPLTVWALVSRYQLLALIPVSASLVVLSGAHLRRASSEFAVTNRRVIIALGILNTRSIELPLSRIEAITVEQNLFGRIFGYGQIVVTGSSGTHDTFVDIQSPLEFRQAVQAVAEPAA